ncbi:MAG: 6-carboxytetrahydropterin synthase [Salinivirgaceae bacterium]|jgi:6-pyruvoyltetrahydropterin/6-carboxytetrahydropterin synthase|nr:6-carboxytetrahydropterin synthase [Salinivirgaceae bacterium]
MVYLTRRERFNSAHRLFNSIYSDEKNFQIYGKCANPNWHGHNYELFVTIKGEVDEEAGVVINLKELSQIIKTRIIDKLDHKNLNLEVDFLKNKIVSTENIVIAIWNELEPEILETKAQLHKIRLIETENNFAEYYGKNSYGYY